MTHRHTSADYWLAWAATLLFFGGFYTLLAPLPNYLGQVGMADWQIGLVLGAFGVASLLGRPLAGLATDRLGPQPVLLAGAGALLLGATLVPLFAGVAAQFGLRVLQAAGYVAFTTAGTALVIAMTPPEVRGQRLAIFGAAANVAIALIPAAMSALLADAPLWAAFLAAGGFALAAGLLALPLGVGAGDRGAPQGQTNDQRPPRNDRGRLVVGHSSAARSWAGAPSMVLATFGSLAIPRRLWLPMLAAGLQGAGFAAFFQFAPLLVERRPVIAIGALYTVYGAGIILARVLGGRLIDRLGVRRSVALAAALMALGLALIALTAYGPLLPTAPGDALDATYGRSALRPSDLAIPRPTQIIAEAGSTIAYGSGAPRPSDLGMPPWLPIALATLLIAAGSGIFHPALIAHHAALWPEAPGRATAAFYVGFDLGIGLGSWLFGLALQLGGLAALYGLAALLVALTLLLVPRLRS